ncbi:MAG TPA: formylglycine-generating enzyme family protein [Steroidobacteraceae bacterium]|nr:formylglycine-generating enzyme family protein [Steroidobacteraceae bacterium]
MLVLVALPAVAALPVAEQVTLPAAQFSSTLPQGEDQAEVEIRSFRLDRHPVTNGEFLEFVRANPQWRRDRIARLFADPQYLAHWQGSAELGSAARPAQPVTRVSWFAAKAYCEARGERLPTWYEWEYAAAASETTADARNDPAWRQRILDWYAQPSTGALPDVERGTANFYGAQDLHGLVWEWVLDYNALLVSNDSREQGGADRLQFCGEGALSAADRDNYAVLMRIAYLSALEARFTTANLGFRCAGDSR